MFGSAPQMRTRKKLVDTLLALGYDEYELVRLEEVNFCNAQHIRLAGPIDVLTVVHFRIEYDNCRSRAKEFFTKKVSKFTSFTSATFGKCKILARRPKRPSGCDHDR